MSKLYAYTQNQTREEATQIQLFTSGDPKALKKLFRKVTGWYKALETHTRDNGDVCLYVSQLLVVSGLEADNGLECADALHRNLDRLKLDASVTLDEATGVECEVELFIKRGKEVESKDWDDVAGLPSKHTFTTMVFEMDWTTGLNLITSYCLNDIIPALTAGCSRKFGEQGQTVALTAMHGSKTFKLLSVEDSLVHTTSFHEGEVGQVAVIPYHGSTLILTLSEITE